MKHTLGPWSWYDGFALAVGPANDPEGDALAHVIRHPEQAFANARLIAAAPDMLAALQILLGDMEKEYRDGNGDTDHDGIDFARAAIAKATGEQS